MNSRVVVRVMKYLLMALLLLTGCMKQDVEEVAMGRYVEESIGLPEMFDGLMMQETEDEIKVATFSEDQKNLIYYTLSTDGTWNEQDRMSISLSEDIDRLLDAKVDSKGVLVAYISNEGNICIDRQRADGTVHSVTLVDEETPYESLTELNYKISQATNGDIIVLAGCPGVLKVYDGETGEIKKIYHEEVCDYQLLEEQLYVMTCWKDSTINVYNLITGDIVESINYPNTDSNNMLYVKDKGIYLFNKGGIQYKSSQGSIWETIIEPSMTCFSREDMALSKVFALANDKFYVLFYSDEGLQLKRYYYDEEIPNKPNQEVSVYMSYDVPNLRQAIVIYQKAHPDVYINIIMPSDHINMEDAIQNLNTELLEGAGPDLIVLDTLPIDTYIEKGLLTDLKDIVQPYIKNKQGYEKVLRTFSQGDKIYAVPSRFRVPMLWGSAEVLSEAHSLHELAEYKKAHPDQVLFNKNMVELYGQLSDICFRCWVDEKGHYSREKVQTFIEDLEMITEDKENDEWYERRDLEKDKYSEVLDVAEGKAQVCILESRNPQDINCMEAILDARGDGMVVPFEVDEKAIYKPIGVMGMNSNSQNQEIVREIIQIALSTNVQGMINWLGMPLSEKDLSIQEDSGFRGYNNVITDDKGRNLIADSEPGQYYTKCIENHKLASLYCDYNADLAYMIYDAIKEYSEARQPLEKVLDSLDEKIRMLNME